MEPAIPPSNFTPLTVPPAAIPRPQLVPADAPQTTTRPAPAKTVAMQKGEAPPAATPATPTPAPAPNLTPGGYDPKDLPPGVFFDRNQKMGSKALGTFRLQSDSDLQKRITKELIDEETARLMERKKKGETDVRFPTDPESYYRSPTLGALVPPGTQYQSKTVNYPPMKTTIEPDYVVHRRLYFEQINNERYGWDLGIIQPAVSTLAFYKDTLLWPARLASYPFERYDTSAGKCYPGSPVPYYLYPPEISLFGGTVGVGTIVGVAALIP